MASNLFKAFLPTPDAAEMLTDPGAINKTYRYWRLRLLYSTFIGYATYYLVRQNISVAMPALERSLGLGKAQLGLFLTLHKLLYGVSKFVNGFLGDRTNPRYFMALGLLFSALMNIMFGLSSSVMALGIFWMLNGWFQGMGFPPCARVLSQWFSPKERGTKWAAWNASHQIGAFVALGLSSWLAVRELSLRWESVPRFFGQAPITISLAGWQLCFIVPAVLAVGVTLLLINRLRDTPASLGLPPVEVYKQEPVMGPLASHATLDKEAMRRLLKTHVFGNKYIWYISLANFFVYVLRYGFLDWAPSCLQEMKGIALHYGGWMTAGFEIFGLFGSVLAGWLTDRYMKGRRAPLCVFYMLAVFVLTFLFWQEPSGHPLLTTVLLFMLGFFVYGPQFLVGVMTADIATKHAAATAIGLTGLFGYLSGIVSGWGLGWTVDHYGWNGAFALLLVCAAAGTVFFSLAWNARPFAEKSV